MFSNLILQPCNVDTIIYHNPCNDGFTSALAGYIYAKEHNKDITFIGMNYDTEIPDIIGKNVLILDFSFKKDQFEKMINLTNRIAIIDHHKSAMYNLEDVSLKYKVFDMNSSGATLAWQYFFPDREIPLFFRYIEDNDLWHHKMEKYKEFNSMINTYKYDFTEYVKFMNDDYLLNAINNEGSIIAKYNDIVMSSLVENASPKFVKIAEKYYFVILLNSTVLKSELGNKVFDIFPNANFSAIYSTNDYDNSTYYSLRSTNDRTDVSLIASLYGGGGHRNASGLKLYGVNYFPDNIIDNLNCYDVMKYLYAEKIEISGTIYNVVLLNSNICKQELGTYLLQHRTQKDNIFISEASYYLKSDHNYILAGIWHYCSINNKTYYTICFSSDESIDNIKNICNKLNINKTNNHYTDERGSSLLSPAKTGCYTIEYDGLKTNLH
jgi:oligoribonuclease NrnB/cAMP/cGMP phosphodiesterase (DHH superfamily)